MKYSKEFTELIERSRAASKYVKELVAIEEISWSSDQNGIFVRTTVLQNDGSHCGHGIGIYFNSIKANFTLLADGERIHAPFDVVFKQIKNLLPKTTNIFTAYGFIDNLKSRLDSEIDANRESEKKIKYLEAKLFIKEYEEEISKKAEKSLPF